MEIAIIGAGIMGLSTAYRLKVAFPEINVVVISKDFSPNTISNGAAGLWEPFITAQTPEALVKYVSIETWKWLKWCL